MMALNFRVILPLLCLLYPLVSGHCVQPLVTLNVSVSSDPTNSLQFLKTLNVKKCILSPRWSQVWNMDVYAMHASAGHSSWETRVSASVQHHAINGSCRVGGPELSPHPTKGKGQLCQDEETPAIQEQAAGESTGASHQ